MKTVMERSGTAIKADGLEATIPNNVSMISVFAINSFIPNGNYNNDGWIYVNKKPVKKWFKKIEYISVWFPILNDLHKLQNRYLAVAKKYRCYLKKEYRIAFNSLVKVGKAHAKITHKFNGDCDPWWLYEADKYPGQKGICWNWVKIPENPLNLEIGNTYYKIDQRLSQLTERVSKFRIILEWAICDKVYNIKGNDGQILQYKLSGRSYWFIRNRYVWDKLAFPEDDVKVVEG